MIVFSCEVHSAFGEATMESSVERFASRVDLDFLTTSTSAGEKCNTGTTAKVAGSSRLQFRRECVCV